MCFLLGVLSTPLSAYTYVLCFDQKLYYKGLSTLYSEVLEVVKRL